MPSRHGIARVALVTVHASPLAQPGSGDGGGLNVYVLHIARLLAQQGIHVDVFTRAQTPHAPASVSIAENAWVHHLAAGPPGPLSKTQIVQHLGEFSDALAGHKSAGSHDLYHGHYWLSGIVGATAARRTGVPLVQTFHTLGAVKNRATDDVSGAELEPAERLESERGIARSADRIAATTCDEARFLHMEFGLSGASIAVVPGGVDRRLFSPDGPVDRWARSPGPRLLFVGRLQPVKAPDVAIETLAQVRRTHPDANLIVVGGTSGDGVGLSGPVELQRLADSIGVGDAVRFMPALPQSQLPSLYRAADVVVVPSRSESFGLVALEAQSCGTPVVAAAVGGLRAVVRGGALVPGHDAEDHAAAVVGVLEDGTIANEGLIIARIATWDRTISRLLSLYQDAVQARSAPPQLRPAS